MILSGHLPTPWSWPLFKVCNHGNQHALIVRLFPWLLFILLLFTNLLLLVDNYLFGECVNLSSCCHILVSPCDVATVIHQRLDLFLEKELLWRFRRWATSWELSWTVFRQIRVCGGLCQHCATCSIISKGYCPWLLLAQSSRRLFHFRSEITAWRLAWSMVIIKLLVYSIDLSTAFSRDSVFPYLSDRCWSDVVT